MKKHPPINGALIKRRAHSPTRIIVGSFFVVILLGTLLLCLPFAQKASDFTLLDALFTATSATCVTGLIVADTYSQFTLFGQIVILLLIQVGGLGLVTLTSFFNVLIGRRLGFNSMRLASESISTADASQAGHLLRFIIRFALLAEGIGAVLLAFVFVPQFGGEGVFISIFLSVSAFCNAGFDILGRLGPFSSLTHYAANGYVLVVISVLIISGGLGFLVWHDLVHYRRTRHLRTHTKLVLGASAVLLVLGTVLFAALEWRNPATLGNLPTGEKLLNAAFQSVSTRTAGFNSVELSACGSITKLFMILLMFIGAAPGGTGGGIKLTTVAVIFVAVWCVVTGREEAEIVGKRIPHSTIYKALAILVLSAMVVLCSAVLIHFNSDAGLLKEIDTMFETTSAFATVGLSVGVTSQMNSIARAVAMLTMFIGRVGPVSLAITLSSRANKGRRDVRPQANITVA